MTARTILRFVLAVLAVALLPLTSGFSAVLAFPAVFGVLGQDAQSDAVRVLIAWGILDGSAGYKKRIKVKTADYTILSPNLTTGGDPSGTIFTNRGATGAVIFTLPAPVAALAGVFYEFLGLADQNFSVVAATADTLVVVNDLTADSLAVSTSSHKIGAHMRAVCDGTSWIAYGDSVGDTFTVAT